MRPAERQAALEAVAAEVRNCTRCPLHAQRTRAVPGHGDPETEVVFVGEGPGYNEDQQGLPFVGAAGNLLNELLVAIGWRREDVFVTNVVKCRPPGNRDPEPAEIAACAPYLRRQLEVLDPAVVVTLGRHSLQTFMPGARISSAHGTQRPVDAQTGAPDATAYAMYHPAAALRQGALRRTMLEDMAGLPEVLLEARQRRAQRAAAVVAEAPAQATPFPAASTRPEAHAPIPHGGPAEPDLPRPLPVAAEPVATAVSTRDPDDQLELF